MKESIVLTLKESDALLEILTELPIKYSQLFTKVQMLLFDKFNEAQPKSIKELPREEQTPEYPVVIKKATN